MALRPDPPLPRSHRPRLGYDTSQYPPEAIPTPEALFLPALLTHLCRTPAVPFPTLAGVPTTGQAPPGAWGPPGAEVWE